MDLIQHIILDDQWNTLPHPLLASCIQALPPELDGDPLVVWLKINGVSFLGCWLLTESCAVFVTPS